MATPDTATELPPSLWAATAESAPDCPPLSGAEEADVAIVGGGFTGLSAALHLAEAGQTVCLIEAAEPGWGASGRNGGQVNPGWKILPDEIMVRFGPERGARVTAMADTTCDLVFDLIARHDIRCDAVRPGYIQGAHGERGRRMLDRWIRQWSRHGAPVDWLSKAETADLIGTGTYDIGMLDRRGGNLQPLSYARGLARAAQAAGAQVHGATRALAVQRDGAEWLVEAEGGSLRARNLLLCTNGYTDRLWPGLRQTVVPVTSFITATKPLSSNLLKTVLPQRHAVSETRRDMLYYRLDRDGRLVFGGRGNRFDGAQRGVVSHLRKLCAAMFPQLADVDWDYNWGGYVAATKDHVPKLMQPAPGVFAGLGYNGRGIAMSTIMGKQLSLAVLGEDPDMPVQPIQRIPFHAFRQIGISWYLVTGPWLDALDRRRAVPE